MKGQIIMVTSRPKCEIDLQIVWMQRGDMAQVMDIEKRCFKSPWSEEQFMAHLRQHTITGMVAQCVSTGQIIGFMIFAEEPGYLDLLSFAVDPEFQRHGVGLSLMANLKTRLGKKCTTSIVAEVRDTLKPMHELLKKTGFIARAVNRGGCWDTDDDSYVFEFRADGVKKPITSRQAEILELLQQRGKGLATP